MSDFQKFGATGVTTTVQEELFARILSSGDVEQTLQAVLNHGINPYSGQAMQMQAMMAMRKGDYPLAEQWIAKCIAYKKDHLSLKIAADCAFLQNQFDKAETIYRDALTHKPDSPEITHDLGVSIVSQGRVEESLTWFKKASALSPGNAQFLHHLAIMLVLGGHDKEGWDMMQWRLHYHGVVGTFPHPERYWQGEDITGKTIIIRTEQGWGDAIMFAGYLPWILARAKKVYIYSQRALMRWFEANYPDAVVWPNDAPPPLDFDYHVNIMCFPRLIPDGYKRPEQRLSKGEGVGVCWFGSPTHKADRLRTVPVERFAPIAEAAGEQLYCLGYGRFTDKPPFMDYLIDTSWDWFDTQHRIKNLDLIITVDTAIAHMGGYLGVETWLLLPYTPDFRWGMTGESTPWYESIRIYRQPKLFDWDSVFDKVCKDLSLRQDSRSGESAKTAAAAP